MAVSLSFGLQFKPRRTQGQRTGAEGPSGWAEGLIPGERGVAVLPVNYALQDGAVVFRTATNGPLDEDLRTGITDADYKVAFEIDSIDLATRQGWSVLIQGPAHHVTGTEEDAVREAGVEPWAP